MTTTSVPAVLTLLASSVLFAGCTTTPPSDPAIATVAASVEPAATGTPTATPTATVQPLPADVLFTVRYYGGLCVEGTCDTTITVRANGTWAYTRPGLDDRVEGPLDDVQLERARVAVATTTIPDAPPFTDVCPIAYDGQAVIYTWTDPATDLPRAYDSCDKAIPENDPLAELANEITGIALRAAAER